MIRFGGTNGLQWFNDVWTYEPRTNVWSQLDCIGYIPAPREGHSAALVNDVMYIFGGRTEEGTDLGDLAAFRITSRRWYTFQNMGPSPSPRSGHSMTAYGKQIVVLAGEPSSAPRDTGELSMVYVLDTGKIRYPNDQQIQQTPSGERVPGNRRPSGERSAIPQSKGMAQRDQSAGPSEGPRRLMSGSRESMNIPPGTINRGMEPPVTNGPPASIPPTVGNGSRLPRASMAQAPSGPPPQQQAPTAPRTNGVSPTSNAPRSKTPTKDTRNFGPPLDTSRTGSFEKETVSPITPATRESPRGNRANSPMMNGRRTPTQQPPSRLANNLVETAEPPKVNGVGRSFSSSRQGQRQGSFDDFHEPRAPSSNQQRLDQNHHQVDRPDISPLSNVDEDQGFDQSSTQFHGLADEPIRPNQRKGASVTRHDGHEGRQDDLVKELEAAKRRSAWYASELALAQKAGYQKIAPESSDLEGPVGRDFRDEDKPLIEALIAMRSELAEVQGSVESRVQDAAQKVAEVESQRDAAIREAVYAKAKLAAHGGSARGTPQFDESSRDVEDPERSAEMNHKLAGALAAHSDLKSRLNAMEAELQSERRAREIAEDTSDAAQRRATELTQSHNPGEVESLRARLHEVERDARDHAAQKATAHSRAQMLEVDHENMSRQLEDATTTSQQHTSTLESLREAMTAAHNKSTLLEGKLDEERGHRESIAQKLRQLRAEHEERTAELDSTSRRLRDAEILADANANEAQKHRQVMLSGLENLNNRSATPDNSVVFDKRVNVLQQQVENANALVKKYQTDADTAAEKLRAAEERIAGLETYQEQASKENMTLRKQLQEAVSNGRSLQLQRGEVQRQLESHQRDASALSVQHNALKELLNERGINGDTQRSRDIDSPSGGRGTAETFRVRELEQQLEESVRAHEGDKSSFESREQEAERTYREKLEQLEQDYQSAVHYVKGTEKMLKRMKDELTKYKTQNAGLQRELEDSHRSMTDRSAVPADWENERQSLRREIEDMQTSVKSSVSQLEQQVREVRRELQTTQNERDHYSNSYEETQRSLNNTATQARTDLEQLKNENAQLESRATDAEQKVSFLLDQVGNSVDNYRRQSQTLHAHARNPSTQSSLSPTGAQQQQQPQGMHSQTNSIGADSAFSATSPDNRNSIALDSLASELETLRTQWEGTHRSYRLSSQFDFERTPTAATHGGGASAGSGNAGGGELSDSLASWRKRLDAEEKEKEGGGGGSGSSNRSPVLGSGSGHVGNGSGGVSASATSPMGGRRAEQDLAGGDVI